MGKRLSAGGRTLVEIAELAQLMRVTDSTVGIWIKAGMPVVHAGSRGRGANRTLLDLHAALSWYFETSYERLNLERQKTRLTKALADRQEIALAERYGELVDVVAVTQKFNDRIANAKERLREIAPRLAAQLVNVADPQLIGARIAAEIDATLTELAGRAPGRE